MTSLIENPPPGQGYLAKLPPEHQRLVDDNKGKISRIMSALVIDQELPDGELGVIILADLKSDVARAVASVSYTLTEVRDEIQNAMIDNRRPVIVDAVRGEMASDLLGEIAPQVIEYATHRSPGSLVLLVVDEHDNAAATMVVPVISRVVPGSN